MLVSTRGAVQNRDELCNNLNIPLPATAASNLGTATPTLQLTSELASFL